MFVLNRPFYNLMFVGIILAQLTLQSLFAMNGNKVVEEPFVRIITLFVFFKNAVPESFLYTLNSSNDNLDKKYQVSQFLYNEQYNNSNYSVANKLVYDQMPILYGALQIFLAEPLVDVFDENKNKVIQIPMGSSFYVKKHNNDSLEFFDHAGNLRLVSTKSVHLLNDLVLLNDDEFRELVCSQALKLEGQPFQWGGRSVFKDSGFDASGFVNIVYLSCGVKVDRSLVCQHLKNKIIEPNNLQKGDLIFMCDENSYAQTVLLYLGNDEIIEAYPVDGCGKITKAKFSDLFGKAAVDYNNGEFVKEIGGDRYFIQCREVLRSSQPLSFV